MALLERKENENEEQFLWRVGQAKDSGTLDLSWEEIGNIINKEFRDDETEYRTESAYRKSYQQAKRFVEAGVFNELSGDKYLDELREQKHKIRKEKQKLFDERTALNKTLRETARTEEDLDKLKTLIENNSKLELPEVKVDHIHSDNDLIICLSDFHLGIDTDNYFGTFNSEVASKMLFHYLEKIIQIKNIHNSENAYLIFLGDMLSGNIHFTTQLENRENVVEQVQKSAELLSRFAYELSKYFGHVYVNGVAGNHSRLSFKDQVLRGERLDNLIPWYMKAKLSHITNIAFIDSENYDPTIGYVGIRGNDYLLVHGDYDSFNEKGMSRLVMMVGYKPTAIFYGHLHHCSFDEISGVKIIRSGSFSGTSDDFCVTKRLSGGASQMVCVVDCSGISACYPIPLNC